MSCDNPVLQRIYAQIHRILELDREKDEIIDKLVDIIVQQYGVEALDIKLLMRIREIAEETEKIREGE